MSVAGWFRRSWFRRPPQVLLIDDAPPDVTIGAGVPLLVAFLQSLSSTGVSVSYWPTRPDLRKADSVGTVDTYGARVIADRTGGISTFLAHRGSAFDAVIVARPHNMQAFRDAQSAYAPLTDSCLVVYFAEAFFADRDIAKRRVLGPPMDDVEGDALVAAETGLASSADIVLAVNGRTADAFADRGHRDVRVLGYTVEPRSGTPSFQGRNGFLFIGPTYRGKTPNTDSVIWFAENVAPLLAGRFDQKQSVTIVGECQSEEVKKKAASGFELAGSVADLTPYYGAARVFFAPTRFAAGIPLKVFHAAAHGVPVVMTSVLAEQIGWVDEQQALVADTPEAFADACYRLHEDQELWDRIRANALERIRADLARERFDDVVNKLVGDIALRAGRRVVRSG